MKKVKDAAAVSLAKKRWAKNTDPVERSENARAVVAERWANSTEADRVEVGKKLAAGRAAKKKAIKKVTKNGVKT